MSSGALSLRMLGHTSSASKPHKVRTTESKSGQVLRPATHRKAIINLLLCRAHAVAYVTLKNGTGRHKPSQFVPVRGLTYNDRTRLFALETEEHGTVHIRLSQIKSVVLR